MVIAQGDAAVLHGGKWPDAGCDGALDAGHHPFGGGGLAVGHQPAGAFRDPAPHHQGEQADEAPDNEGGPPAIGGQHDGGVEHDEGAAGVQGGADPEAAVDHEVYMAAATGGDQLLYSGVN